MIVVDASAALVGLFDDGPARRSLGAEQLHAPHLVDTEAASGLRRVAVGQLTEAQGVTVLNTWRELAVIRYAVNGFLDRVWELRHNLSAYDAG